MTESVRSVRSVRSAREQAHAQASYGVRCDWGPTGGVAIAAGAGVRADVAVVIDVLSFTTTLTVAVERGITVFPYRWRDAGAQAYADERGAVLAVGRLEQREAGEGVSLSPAAMSTVTGLERIVLPSPNGSSISFLLADSGAQVVGACLRNASAVAARLAPQVEAGAAVAVVPAGERWPDGSLRPAVEDLWGAGAVLAALADAVGSDRFSPEASYAAAAFRDVAPRLSAEVMSCASGRELVAAGFAADVEVAARLDVSVVVPLLVGEAFNGGSAG